MADVDLRVGIRLSLQVSVCESRSDWAAYNEGRRECKARTKLSGGEDGCCFVEVVE